MKRLSIYLLFSVTLIFLVVSFDMYFQRKWNLEFYRKDFFARTDHLNGENMVARMISRAVANKVDLQQYLESRRQMGRIDFWIILQNGKADLSSLPTSAGSTALIAGLNLKAKSNEVVRDIAQDRGSAFYYAVDQIDWTPQATPVSGQVSSQIVVGLIYNENEFLKTEYRAEASYIWRYLIGVLTISIGTFVFFIRDIINGITRLKDRTLRKGSQAAHANSREAEILNRGMLAMSDQNQQLQSSRDALLLQTPPSLVRELSSGRKPPYEFTCTLVRTDINGFTEIFNNFPLEPFYLTLNQFFTETSRIVERYQGYVHEFVGDEVIFYFKDDEVKNSTALALAAIRDINSAAARFDLQTKAQHGHSFTIKSAVAQGRLRVGQLVDGYGISGPPLVESVRVLAQVTERDGNAVVCEERHEAHAREIASFTQMGSFSLKGYAEPKNLLSLKSLAQVETLLTAGQNRNLLAYFRSDSDILKIFAWLRSKTPDLSPLELRETTDSLRDIRITENSAGVPPIANELGEWLLDLLRYSEQESSSQNEQFKSIASIVSLVQTLLPRQQTITSVSLRNALSRCLQCRDRRVVANAVEAITHFDQTKGADQWRSLLEIDLDLDHRITGNWLAYEGKREVNSKVVKKLRRMLNSQVSGQVTAGLYALGEIALHHSVQDPVYYNTRVDFLELVADLRQFLESRDINVRRQAHVVAEKIGLQRDAGVKAKAS